MKKLLILGVLIIFASNTVTIAQSPRKKTTSTFTTSARGRKPGPAPKPPPIQRQNAEGVLPRAFQPGGNPFQMLNPKAPAQYGKAEDSVVLDPDTGKWKGIKLFSFNF
jgi:hypothetical protein